MRVEYVEPFVKAAFTVIESVVNSKPTRGQLAIRGSASTGQQIAVVLSVSGNIEGKVLYAMSMITAQKIASSVLNTTLMSFDEVAQSTMLELGNRIVQDVRRSLAEAGYACEFAPLKMARGADDGIDVGDEVPTLVVPMLTQFGRIEIDVALTEQAAEVQEAA